MKKIYRSIMVMSLFLMMSATSFAEDIQHIAPPATPPKDTGMKHEMGGGMGMQHGMGGGMGMHHGMGGGMGMGGMMAGMTEEQKDAHMRSMQEHMLKMHDFSNQILAEKDAAKKEALKKQQLELMKAHHKEMMQQRLQMQGKALAK